MHYRNGREAHNGDKVVMFSEGKPVALGVLHGAVPGNNTCNGNLAPLQPGISYACLCDCLHVDDMPAVLEASGLLKRPEGV